MLKNGQDPLGKGLIVLLERGATSAVFLAIQPTATTMSPVPLFLATAALAPRTRLQLWTGLSWDPRVAPELWNHFVQNGFVELCPPGTQTQAWSARNLVRAAFGVEQGEWLVMVRVGPADSCRGLLAVVANRSLSSDLQAVLPLLFLPTVKAA